MITKELFKKVRKEFKLNQAEFSEKVNLSLSMVGFIERGEKPISDSVIAKLKLLLHENNYKIVNDSIVKIDSLNKENYQKQRLDMKNSDNNAIVPVYDIDFIAGTTMATYNDLSKTEPSYNIYFPQFRGCTGFYIHNDSMEPKIISGSLVFARQIIDLHNNFEYGKIYGIVLKDGRRLLKYLRKSNNGNNFLAVSENKTYDDMELQKSVIKSLWQIDGWVSIKS